VIKKYQPQATEIESKPNGSEYASLKFHVVNNIAWGKSQPSRLINGENT
jgi:hypothetical protein